VPVSSTLRSAVQSYELVVSGELSPAVVDALDGFEIVGADDRLTYLAGRVDSQGHLYDMLAVVGASNVHLVSLSPMIDAPL
jgi:hypothetical protein